MIVSVRGIERVKIFRSDYDRRNFLNHLGKLIPDRYKSILCQEDPYLKELVRYIQNVRLCLRWGIFRIAKTHDCESESTLFIKRDEAQYPHPVLFSHKDFRSTLSPRDH